MFGNMFELANEFLGKKTGALVMVRRVQSKQTQKLGCYSGAEKGRGKGRRKGKEVIWKPARWQEAIFVSIPPYMLNNNSTHLQQC